MGGLTSMEPLYSVAVQLKTLMALGTATRNVRSEKIRFAVSDMPLVNMWCPQTREPKKAIAMRGVGNRFVAENRPVREGRNDFGDGAHGRQDHDVDRRMRVDPEKMLIEERIAPLGRIEHSDPEQAFRNDQKQRDPDDGRREQLNPGRSIQRPGKQRHAMPRHAGSAQPVNRGNESSVPVRMEEKPRTKAPKTPRVILVLGLQAERSIKSPSGIRRAVSRKQRRNHNGSAGDEEVPRQQVQPREGHIFCADHDGQKEIAENRGKARQHKHENHDDAVHRKEGIVDLRREQGRIQRELLDSHEHADGHGNEEKNNHGGKVQDPDPFMIRGKNPAQDSLALPSSR